MSTGTDIEGSLKLSDFDYAMIFDSTTKVLPHQIGTRAYAPPQRFSSLTKLVRFLFSSLINFSYLLDFLILNFIF